MEILCAVILALLSKVRSAFHRMLVALHYKFVCGCETLTHFFNTLKSYC